MYQYYDITLQGVDNLTLTYKLEQHRPAQVWAGLIHKYTPIDLRNTLHPWQNFDKSRLPKIINDLEKVIDDLNEWLPEDRKIKDRWNHDDHQGSVNKLHIHFPDLEKTETDIVRISQLANYNDLIHEIEDLTTGTNEYRPYLLICPKNSERVELELNDYKFFKASRQFGELCLHYCHVGRHPYELYCADDRDCPIDQIVPQYSISPFHTLRFYSDPVMEHWHKGKFKKFYEVSSLKNKIAWNDPKMAFGYIPLGKLVTDMSSTEVLERVKSCDRIIDWKVK